MKKNNTITIFLFLFISLNSFSQFTEIPDADFERWLINLGIDSDRIVNGRVLTSDISGITSLDAFDNSISRTNFIYDLTGIEDFISLEYLDIRSIQISKLDVSTMPNLKTLLCSGNNLTQLDVSKNLKLEYLDCYSNQILQLDVTQNTLFNYLSCAINEIDELDTTQNPLLTELICHTNPLAKLDLSNNANLISLTCGSQYLSSLDLSQNTKLEYLNCRESSLSSLNLSQNPELSNIDLSFNALTNIDFTHNPKLAIIRCNNNRLLSIDLSSNPNLEEIYCTENSDLTQLNVRNGNNQLISRFRAQQNQDLFCIVVDDPNYSEEYWPYIDDQAYYSNDCSLPKAFEDEYTLLEDTTLSVVDFKGVLSNDFDADPLTATLVNNANNGFVSLNSDGSFTYTPNANFYGTDSFTYIANDGINDTEETTVYLTIEVDGYDIMVPNAFTPNNDGVNDYFLPAHKGMQSIRLEVYDTWGNLIYLEEREELIGWDVTIRGRIAENGNYLYKILGTTLTDKAISLNGLFTLIK